MDGGRSRWSDLALTALRIVAGFLFLCHGGQKLLGWFADPTQPPQAIAFPQLPWFAGVIELVGGALILVGFLTRPAAFLASGEMAFAYFMAHAPHGFVPLVNHGELAALYCFLWLFFAIHGAGPYALDAAMRRRRL